MSTALNDRSRDRHGVVRHGSTRLGALLAAALAAAVLAACGSAPGAVADGGDAAGSVTLEQPFGTATIPANPTRVATVGYNDQDFVLALGMQPVTTRSWFDEYNSFPWVLEPTGGEGVPVAGGDEINFEEIAASRPEVILAIYETVDQSMYDRLSAIAPTVVAPAAYPDGEMPWADQQLLTGKALGKEVEAQALVDDVTAAIDQAKADHPEFAGKVLVVDYGPENGGHFLIGAGDPRRALFDALGFVAQDGEGDLSEENLSALDRDVLFVIGATKEQMSVYPAFTRLGVVQQDRTLYTTFSSALGGALSYSGPDALLYAIDSVVPELANALNGAPVNDLSGS